MMSTIRRSLPFPLLPLVLAGCSALSTLGEASRPLEIYELQTPVVQAATAGPRAIEMVVEEPVASGALTTERIMIRPSPLQAQYLPGVRWADTAPVMLQTLMVRSLTQTGALASVGRRPVGTLADLTVLSELTDFQAETNEETDGATIRIRLSVRVVRESDSRVVSNRTFAVSEAAASTEIDTIVAAFDRASTRLMAEVIPWLLVRSAST